MEYLHAHVLKLHCIFQSCVQNLLGILEIALCYMYVHKALTKVHLPSMEVKPVQPALDIRILMTSALKSLSGLAAPQIIWDAAEAPLSRLLSTYAHLQTTFICHYL